MLVSLRGEADLLSATSLEDQLRRALESGADRVVVDLGALNFIDSISLRVLLKASLASRQDSDRLYFRRAGSQVERILEVSGVRTAAVHRLTHAGGQEITRAVHVQCPECGLGFARTGHARGARYGTPAGADGLAR